MNMPTPEDMSSRQYPIAETINVFDGRVGSARVDIGFLGNEPYTFFSIIRWQGGQRITHWRWAKNPISAASF